jgi:glycosyltransferase involved in cell wall biosynthesis
MNKALKFLSYDNIIIKSYINLFFKNLYYILNLNNEFKKIKPDIVITKEIFSLCSLQVHLLKKKFNFKHVILVYENTDLYKSLWSLFPLTLLISFLNRDSIFISTSQLATNTLLKLKVNKNNIIQSFTGLLPKEFKKINFNKDNFIILFIGNLNKNKGLKTLIKAFEILNLKGYNNIFLYIAGKGKLKKYIIKKSKRLKNLKYFGFVKEDEKIDLLLNSDLFVYPSEDIYFLFFIQRWKEQTATSVLEAMRAGLPIIVSDSGSLPEIVGREDVVFRQRDYNQLAEKIILFYNNPELRNEVSKFNIERFTKYFNIIENARKIENQIKDM